MGREVQKSRNFVDEILGFFCCNKVLLTAAVFLKSKVKI